MKVSVIIPVYNVKPYLERCVLSVMKQTYKDYEIILVDDGSTDGSSELCDCIAANQENIIVVHQKNQGLSGARNTGILKARGEYLVFLDSDDEWLLEDGLEELLQLDRADLITFKRTDIWKNGNRTQMPDYDIEDINRMPNTQDIFSYLVTAQKLQISACFHLIRRQIILDNNIFFPVGLTGEDIFWTMHLWQHITTVRFANLELYGYHHRSGSITQTTSIHSYRSTDQIFSHWENLCNNDCVNKDSIRAFLANRWVNSGCNCYRLSKSEKREALAILNKHKNLLTYALTHKTKLVAILVKLVGVEFACILIGIYRQLRLQVKQQRI